jgi:hypothetical protein
VKVMFAGSSDDLIQVEGCPGGDEFGIYGKGPHVATFNLGGRVRVHAIYDGCWSFAAGQLDESIPFPDWSVRVTAGRGGYSTRLEIDTGEEPVFVGLEPDKRR